MSRAVFEVEQSGQIPTCIDIGVLASRKGDFQTARQMFRTAIRQLKGHANKQPCLLELISRIGKSYFNEGHYDQAGSWYRRALQVSERFYGANTLQAACIMARLADLHVLQRDLSGFEKAFDDIERIYLLSQERDTHQLLRLLIDLAWTLCIYAHPIEARRVNAFVAHIMLEEADSAARQD